ncbi:MAG: putative zinc-binding metallopeptidase [Pseudomonadales bacterium]|nr:putative zinc-binding metallopeptidase [Pseudomonadales bacterium]
MRRLECPRCRNRLFFENSRCLECGAEVAIDPVALDVVVLEAGPGRACANRTGAQGCACNWLAPADGTRTLCVACMLTRTRPDLSPPGAAARWASVEQDKRRLLYGLIRLGLDPTGAQGAAPMRFDLLSDPAARAGAEPSVQIGHAEGIVTLNLEEADPAYRERTRSAMDEPYRTVLGHLRHESGHFFWPRLIARDPSRLAAYRELFGDERADYGAALRRHHEAGPPADWHQHYISAYASSHPWEDWAETFAHLLHLLDTLESAAALAVIGPAEDPYEESDGARLVERFAPVGAAINELNRAMGFADAYPFVSLAPATAKLAFILDIVQRDRSTDATTFEPAP